VINAFWCIAQIIANLHHLIFKEMNKSNQTILAIVLVVACVVLRIASHQTFLANFTPVLAMGLFAGSIFTNKKIAIALPIITMLIGDLYLQLFTTTPGFYGSSQLYNYAAFGLVALLGTTLQNRNAVNIFGYAITGSMLFFIISNLGVWADTTFNLYPKTMSGLANCFTMAIPFYKNSLMSDVLFSGIFFALYAFATSRLQNKVVNA
jgi:hypothetical protein